MLQGHNMDRCMPAHLDMALEANQDRSRFRCRHAPVQQGHNMDRYMPAHLDMAPEAKQDRSRFRCKHAPVQQLNVVAK